MKRTWTIDAVRYYPEWLDQEIWTFIIMDPHKNSWLAGLFNAKRHHALYSIIERGGA